MWTKSFCKSNKENISVVSGSKARTAISDSGSIIGSQRGKPEPFWDRTNVQPSGGSSLGKGSVSTTNGGEKRASLRELVPPLNAARLRPIRQQTRSAIVSRTNPLTRPPTNPPTNPLTQPLPYSYFIMYTNIILLHCYSQECIRRLE